MGFWNTWNRGRTALAADKEAARQKTAEEMVKFLKPLFETNNRRAVCCPSLFTHNQITVAYYTISDLFPDFLTDLKIQEIVQKKGYIFKRSMGSSNFTVTYIG